MSSPCMHCVSSTCKVTSQPMSKGTAADRPSHDTPPANPPLKGSMQQCNLHPSCCISRDSCSRNPHPMLHRVPSTCWDNWHATQSFSKPQTTAPPMTNPSGSHTCCLWHLLSCDAMMPAAIHMPSGRATDAYATVTEWPTQVASNPCCLWHLHDCCDASKHPNAIWASTAALQPHNQ